ncbi:MAG: hypothetical protein ACXVP1_00715 [Thermoleophilia bacterium]
MSVLATIRPTAWDLPLFLHVLGAMLLVGAAATGVRAAFVSEPAQAGGWTRRFAYRTFLLAALPAFVLMRVGAEWMRIKEFGSSGATPHFVIIGYTAADGGGVLLIVGIVIAWLAVRRGRPRLAQAAAVVVGVALIGWLVAVWAMGAKPS